MEWIAVKQPSGSTGGKLVRADTITTVVIRNLSDISFVDDRGEQYIWKSPGTVAAYASLANQLGLVSGE